ncbi:energy-coupling factor ABC transporter substrate-binding protein [Methanococcus sp. CF]
MEFKHVIMIIGIIILTLAPLIMYSGLGEDEGYFGGADDSAEGVIAELDPSYEPWFQPFWEPPSGEIESLLFALQAAIGAIIIGYFFGYNKAKYDAKNQ